MKRKPKPQWADSADCREKYLAARADAQAKANELGFDHGIERNDLFKSFRVFMLPRRENRYGHELRCETVQCEKLDRCQPGHGPLAAGRPGETGWPLS